MGQAYSLRLWTDVLKHRWPTVLGVAVAVLTAFDLRVDAGFVSSLSALVVLMALVYVGAAALDRRRGSWLVLLAGLPLALFVPPTSGFEPSVVLLVAAAVFLALAALYVAPELGAYLVAFALLGHASWDAYHYVRDRVVARSYAEFCGIADLLLGAAILITA